MLDEPTRNLIWSRIATGETVHSIADSTGMDHTSVMKVVKAKGGIIHH